MPAGKRFNGSYYRRNQASQEYLSTTFPTDCFNTNSSANLTAQWPVKLNVRR